MSVLLVFGYVFVGVVALVLGFFFAVLLLMALADAASRL